MRLRYLARYLATLFAAVVIFAAMPVDAEDEIFTTEFELNTYVETRIVITYAFTQNVTSDAFSMGMSVWEVNIDPMGTTFLTSAVDKFRWHLTIGYDLIVHQTVTIAVFSGGTPADTYSVSCMHATLKFILDITVSTQPHYPTVDELASKSIEVLQNELASYVAEMRSHNIISQQNLTTQWIIVLSVFVGWVIQLAGYFRRKPQEARNQ